MRPHDEKRQLRETKRELKRAGRKKVRAVAKHLLETAPEEAHLIEAHYGRYATAHLNGIDRDATRRRPGDGAPGTKDDLPPAEGPRDPLDERDVR